MKMGLGQNEGKESPMSPAEPGRTKRVPSFQIRTEYRKVNFYLMRDWEVKWAHM